VPLRLSSQSKSQHARETPSLGSQLLAAVLWYCGCKSGLQWRIAVEPGSLVTPDGLTRTLAPHRSSLVPSRRPPGSAHHSLDFVLVFYASALAFTLDYSVVSWVVRLNLGQSPFCCHQRAAPFPTVSHLLVPASVLARGVYCLVFDCVYLLFSLCSRCVFESLSFWHDLWPFTFSTREIS